jgi:hypothetical protein
MEEFNQATRQNQQLAKHESWWHRYYKNLEINNFFEWLQEGSWYLFWWATMVSVANQIKSTTFTVVRHSVSLQNVDSRFTEGFFSGVGEVSQKTIDILLPIADALIVLGIICESLGFYQRKNKNVKASWKLASSWICGSLVLAAILLLNTSTAPILLLSAIALKGFNALLACAFHSYGCIIGSYREHVRPLVHNALALATSALTFTTLLYLTIFVAAAATGPIGLATVGTIAALYVVASNLALASSVLMLTTLAAKAMDELIIKPWQKSKEDKQLAESPQSVEAVKVEVTKRFEPQKKTSLLNFYAQKNRVRVVKRLESQNNLSQAKTYLIDEITDKIRDLSEQAKPDPIHQIKIQCLSEIKNKLSGEHDPNALKDEIKKVLKDKGHQGAFRSRLRNVGDVEDIIIAVNCYLRLEDEASKKQASPSHSLNTVVPESP